MIRGRAKRAVISLIIALTGILLIGCRPAATIVTPADVSRHDSVAVAWWRDTVYVHDSVAVRTGGDTVFVDRWRRQYVERLRADTVRICSRDTVHSVVRVPCELTAWQRTRLNTWWWLALALAAIIMLANWRIPR